MQAGAGVVSPLLCLSTCRLPACLPACLSLYYLSCLLCVSCVFLSIPVSSLATRKPAYLPAHLPAGVLAYVPVCLHFASLSACLPI